MKIGMLWFDNSRDNLATKLERAIRYYFSKYDQHANLCFVHPSMVTEPIKIGEVEVRTNRSVLPNHFWIGHNDSDS